MNINEQIVPKHRTSTIHIYRTIRRIAVYMHVLTYLRTGVTHVVENPSRERKSPAYRFPDSKVYGANMGPTWVLSAPDGPHVGPMNLAIRVDIKVGDVLVSQPCH